METIFVQDVKQNFMKKLSITLKHALIVLLTVSFVTIRLNVQFVLQDTLNK